MGVRRASLGNGIGCAQLPRCLAPGRGAPCAVASGAESTRAWSFGARGADASGARGGPRQSGGISVSGCVGERARVETHRKPGEVVICRVQKKVHRDTAPPMAAQMG